MNSAASKCNGFTLLELLVVVGIIGLITTLGLMYMQDSKDKGANASIQSALMQARSQAELYYNSTSRSYEGVCSVGTGNLNTIGRLTQAGKKSYGGNPKTGYTDTVASTWDTEECHDTATTYVVWIPLRDSTSANPRAFCIDSVNSSKVVTSVLGPNVFVCPAS